MTWTCQLEAHPHAGPLFNVQRIQERSLLVLILDVLQGAGGQLLSSQLHDRTEPHPDVASP